MKMSKKAVASLAVVPLCLALTFPVSAKSCTVESGDSLYFIAKDNGISLASLRMANNKWDDLIYPGQRLKLPYTGRKSHIGGYVKRLTSYSQYEIDLLARLITAEADDEPFKAKVGVGAVVLNRVKDTNFPNSIANVIFAKDDGFYQFTPVENGWINKPASPDSRRAAIAAMNGYDPTHGAVYYFDDSTTNKWIWSKPIALRIDKMVYTY